MKKTYLLLFTAFIMLLNACSNDDENITIPDNKSLAPRLTAIVEQPLVTKSGVMEDNDYTQGEKFYWVNGDETNVYLTTPGMLPINYILTKYGAYVSEGVKSNSCVFETIESDIKPEHYNKDYTAYGFFPVSAWGKVATSNLLTAKIPQVQIQTNSTSAHLGAYMLMKAQKEVRIEDNSPINLSYKHLASVLRFAVWNTTSDNSIIIKHIAIQHSTGKPVFPYEAKLANLEETSLTTNVSARTFEMKLLLAGSGGYFSTKNGKYQCEGYMVVMPTDADAFDVNDVIKIELSLDNSERSWTIYRAYNVLFDLPWLLPGSERRGGIEQGKSYYFQLKIVDADLPAPHR